MEHASVRLKTGQLVVPHKAMQPKSSSKSLPKPFPTKTKSSTRSFRQQRVDKALHRCIEDAIETVGHGALERTSVELIGVETTGDMRQVNVYYCVDVSSEWQHVETLFQRYYGQLRHAVGRNVPLKYTPSLSFRAVRESYKIALMRLKFEGVDV